jgi:para-aminobenzoate synthetase component 1
MNAQYQVPGAITLVRELPGSITSFQWYAGLRDFTLPVVLSSGSATHAAGRFDIVCADPVTLLVTHGNKTEVTCTTTGEQQSSNLDPIALLQQYCPVEDKSGEQSLDLPFTGGAIGYFGYELQHSGFGLPHKPPLDGAPPDMLAGIYDWAIVIDHHLHKSTLVMRETSTPRQTRILAAIEQVINGTAGSSSTAAPFALVAPFQSNFTREAYLQRFRRVIDYIRAGDCYQVNLAQCFSAACTGDPFTAFGRLQTRADAPFAAYLEHGDTAVMSFSPERFLKVENRRVTTQPIKGTRPRSNDPARDQANIEDLSSSTKDQAENLMIVDLLRNDIGRVCETGSVKADRMFEIQSFTNVHHLVSTISGRLARAEEVFNLFSACFPGGSITGTPKRRAMEIIDELETMPRSVYCGAIAWFGFNGNMDSNICIRTLVKAGGKVHCWGGGGIVADSEGDAEYQETLDKIGIFINNL